jgi:D-ribulokinase
MYLGIDFGTSGVRSLVLNAEQTIVAETKASYELGDIQTWQLALEEVVEAIPLKIRKQLQAIAIDGTSSTVLICNALGAAIHPPILYNDARGSEIFADLRAIALKSGATGNIAISATSSLAKLLWLAKHLEQNYNFRNQDYYFLHQADWIGYLLHGNLGITDYHNALKLGYDPQILEYPDWLKNLEIKNLLPQVLAPGSAIAPITPECAAKYQINPQCLICAGTTDSTASFMASGANQIGEAVTALGSTLVLKILSSQPIENSDYGVYSHRFGNLWLVGGASNTGGAVLRQFFTDQELQSLSSDILSQEELIKDFATANLNYYPLPSMGERFPINNPQMLPRPEKYPEKHLKSDQKLLYGLLDGIAKIEKDGYDLLHRLGAPAPTRIFTTGGGAKNPLWKFIRSKYLQIEISEALHPEASYGSAVLAQKSRIFNG